MRWETHVLSHWQCVSAHLYPTTQADFQYWSLNTPRGELLSHALTSVWHFLNKLWYCASSYNFIFHSWLIFCDLPCPFLMPSSVLQTGLWPVFRRKFLASNLKVLSLCTCNQWPNWLLDLTLGLQFVMCGSLSCASNFYYDYIQPEGKCFGNNKKI